MSTRLDRSNNAHRRLANKSFNKFRSLKYGSKQHFYSFVNGCYHNQVIKFQENHGSVAPLEVRKMIYKRELRDYVWDVKDHISITGENRYLPKKYR